MIIAPEAVEVRDETVATSESGDNELGQMLANIAAMAEFHAQTRREQAREDLQARDSQVGFLPAFEIILGVTTSIKVIAKPQSVIFAQMEMAETHKPFFNGPVQIGPDGSGYIPLNDIGNTPLKGLTSPGTLEITYSHQDTDTFSLREVQSPESVKKMTLFVSSPEKKVEPAKETDETPAEITASKAKELRSETIKTQRTQRTIQKLRVEGVAEILDFLSRKYASIKGCCNDILAYHRSPVLREDIKFVLGDKPFEMFEVLTQPHIFTLLASLVDSGLDFSSLARVVRQGVSMEGSETSDSLSLGWNSTSEVEIKAFPPFLNLRDTQITGPNINNGKGISVRLDQEVKENGKQSVLITTPSKETGLSGYRTTATITFTDIEGHTFVRNLKLAIN